jgi:hypothetical protein
VKHILDIERGVVGVHFFGQRMKLAGHACTEALSETKEAGS